MIYFAFGFLIGALAMLAYLCVRYDGRAPGHGPPWRYVPDESNGKGGGYEE